MIAKHRLVKGRHFITIIFYLSLFIIKFVAITTSASAMSAEFTISGKELAQKVFDRENGNDVSAQMVMVLVSKNGNEREREFAFYSKDYGERIKQFNCFSSQKQPAPGGIRCT